MGKNKRALVVGLAMCGILSAAKTENAASQIVIHVIHPSLVPTPILLPGEVVATRILASAGLAVRWTHGGSPAPARPLANGCQMPETTIELSFAPAAPKNQRSDALAEARPFAHSGVRITVFVDRVSQVLRQQQGKEASILGHVLAHEIGHVLLRTNAHADTGVMKAHWTSYDYGTMAAKGLVFTLPNAEAIQLNLVRACSPADRRPAELAATPAGQTTAGGV